MMIFRGNKPSSLNFQVKNFCGLILQKFFQYIILYLSNTSFLATLHSPKVCAHHAVADGRFEFLRCQKSVACTIVAHRYVTSVNLEELECLKEAQWISQLGPQVYHPHLPKFFFIFHNVCN